MPNEKRIISKSKLDAIAGAIREKTGSDSTYTPDQMVAAIGAIKTQGDYQEKTFTENGTYTPDAGYDAFSQVTVNVQSTGSNPLQDMLDRSSDTDGNYLFSAGQDPSIFKNLTYEDLAKLDFSNKHYTKTNYMFYNCENLATVPLFDLSSADDISSMFYYCKNLATVPLFDLSHVTYAGYMFYYCENLATVPLFDLSSANNVAYMFYGCKKLTTVSLLNLNFPGYPNSDHMFQFCTNLTTLDFSNIRVIGYQFASYTSLSTLIIRNPTTLATLSGTDAFSNTPIAKGTGYIYVPDDLVDSYKQATNWSTFANQIKPLSELPQGE